jgi:hypothetical protein
MKTKIQNHATCEVRLTIRFLKAKSVHPAEIYRQIVQVCGEGAVNKGNVRKWWRLFTESTTMRDRTAPPRHAHYSNS